MSTTPLPYDLPAAGEPVVAELEIKRSRFIAWIARANDEAAARSLVDAARNLTTGGKIWLLTPAPRTPGGVQPGEVSESAQLAGLVQTKSDRFGDWQGACLTGASLKK